MLISWFFFQNQWGIVVNLFFKLMKIILMSHTLYIKACLNFTILLGDGFF